MFKIIRPFGNQFVDYLLGTDRASDIPPRRINEIFSPLESVRDLNEYGAHRAPAKTAGMLFEKTMRIQP